VLVSGYGEKESFAACARTADGETIIAYIPASGAAIDIDLNKINGRKATAWWYDPQTGKSSHIGDLKTEGIRSFSKPDANDWLLVIDRSASGLPAPGINLYVP
jgi:hypothetical protein